MITILTVQRFVVGVDDALEAFSNHLAITQPSWLAAWDVVRTQKPFLDGLPKGGNPKPTKFFFFFLFSYLHSVLTLHAPLFSCAPVQKKDWRLSSIAVVPEVFTGLSKRIQAQPWCLRCFGAATASTWWYQTHTAGRQEKTTRQQPVQRGCSSSCVSYPRCCYSK